MSNTNALVPFNRASLQETADSLGITQFVSETNWHQTIAGLLIQGGRINSVTHGAPLVVPFNVGFPTQVLGVFTQEIGANAHAASINSITTAQFSIILASGPSKDFYWWAIGV